MTRRLAAVLVVAFIVAGGIAGAISTGTIRLPGQGDVANPGSASSRPSASGGPASGAPSSGVPASGATGSAGSAGSPAPTAGISPAPSGPTSAASATGSPTPGASSPPVVVGAAPTSAVGFRLRKTIVSIGYPLPASASYGYGPLWHAERVGVPHPYESVRGFRADGSLIRAHDGVDIQVKIGTPVLAAFSGVVVDPRVHWRLWDPSLYGNVVVIQSTEPTSPGYYAINAHLSKVSVHIGDTVQRGQVVGLTGITGNAAGTIPHLHFELRAPFLIDQVWGGAFRRIDVFDPLPSLRAADPHGL
jgi:murein DD-endopeptidase MepM/ murein hydrolase activator NlpD